MKNEFPENECWLPSEITECEEFLCGELTELRDYVKKIRGEDIAEQLYVFENRVLYSEKGWQLYQELCALIRSGKYRERDIYGTANDPIGWETIRIFPYEIQGEEYLYEIEKRTVKKIFLMGWSEVRFWDRGLHKKQEIFSPPEKADIPGVSPDEKDFFFCGETVSFSLDAMRNYAEMYLLRKPEERKSRPRFICQKQSESKGNTWNVYVTADLEKYYYGKGETCGDSPERIFSFMENPMGNIACQKKTETRHAVIANFDSWQTFLHAFRRHMAQTPKTKGGAMNFHHNLSERIEKQITEAGNDPNPVSDEITDILKKIAGKCGSSGLNEKEKQIMEKTADRSPKIRMLKRMAECEYVRKRIGKYYGEKHLRSKSGKESAGIADSIIRLIRWISPLWEPQWAGVPVTAGDVPEQQHDFSMRDGNIDISCSWRGAYGDTPAYIEISWTADIMTECELWLRFVNPLTRDVLSEVLLGEEPEGGKIITGDILGFDPSKERWATSLMMLPMNNDN